MKNFLKVHSKKINIIIFFSFLCILGFLSYSYQNKVFFMSFVDEQDNIILGTYLLLHEKLYSDLFSHHQPLGYILSAGIQYVTDPNSLYLLIKRHREVVIAWSLMWSILLYFRFGNKVILSILIYELTKIYIFGNLFLAESLSVYPLMYVAFLYFLKKPPLTFKEFFFLGICVSFIILQLAPVWPVTILLTVLIFIKFNFIKEKFRIFSFILGSIPLLFISLFFLSPYHYFFNTFYINFLFYIPITSDSSFIVGAVKSFLSPLIALFTSDNANAMTWVIKSISLAFLFSSAILLRFKKYNSVVLGVVILALANIRYVSPGSEIYTGFHILPWFALFIVITTHLSFDALTLVSHQIKRIGLIFILFVIPMLTAVYFSNKILFVHRDIKTDQYINYSSQFDFGEAVRIMKKDGDSLFVVPDEWLLYWQAQIPHASFMVNYYQWMDNVPHLREPVLQMFEKNPPEFFYCVKCQTYSFGKYTKDYIMVSKNNNPTPLYVLPEIYPSLTNEQKLELEFYNFTVGNEIKTDK
ncbi:MAG: hypothetical protein QG583_214 [Patescibacteria group bacterium]|nr:hypothetical protein [Patescibacteria group bacterium]